ncbi:MAG: hypothetical protein ACYC4L_09395 [Chloroflexota bacterium]
MGKKTNMRNGGKARKRAAVVSPAQPLDSAAPVPSAAAESPSEARAPIGLRRPGTVTTNYGARRERGVSTAPLSSDYSYIGHELKRIGTLLGIVVVFMIGLSFFFR